MANLNAPQLTSNPVRLPYLFWPYFSPVFAVFSSDSPSHFCHLLPFVVMTMPWQHLHFPWKLFDQLQMQREESISEWARVSSQFPIRWELPAISLDHKLCFCDYKNHIFYANWSWTLRKVSYWFVTNRLGATAVPLTECGYFVIAWSIERLREPERATATERLIYWVAHIRVGKTLSQLLLGLSALAGGVGASAESWKCNWDWGFRPRSQLEALTWSEAGQTGLRCLT